jgi:hypothetical protein
MNVASAGGKITATKLWQLRLPERLPNLQGKWLTLFTVAWCAALALAIGANAYGGYRLARFYDRPLPLGIDMMSGDSRLRISLVHGAEAKVAGLRYGDEIVAIDGRVVPHSVRARGIIRPWIVGPEGAPVQLSINSGDGQVRQVTLTRSQANVDAAYAGTGLTNEAEKWLSIIPTSLVEPLIFIVGALLLYPLRRSCIAALLSLAFLLDAATIRDDFWQAFNVTPRRISSQAADGC